MVQRVSGVGGKGAVKSHINEGSTVGSVVIEKFGGLSENLITKGFGVCNQGSKKWGVPKKGLGKGREGGKSRQRQRGGMGGVATRTCSFQPFCRSKHWGSRNGSGGVVECCRKELVKAGFERKNLFGGGSRECAEGLKWGKNQVVRAMQEGRVGIGVWDDWLG